MLLEAYAVKNRTLRPWKLNKASDEGGGLSEVGHINYPCQSELLVDRVAFDLAQFYDIDTSGSF